MSVVGGGPISSGAAAEGRGKHARQLGGPNNMLLTHQPNSQKSAIVNRNRLLDGKEIYTWAIFCLESTLQRNNSRFYGSGSRPSPRCLVRFVPLDRSLRSNGENKQVRKSNSACSLSMSPSPPQMHFPRERLKRGMIRILSSTSSDDERRGGERMKAELEVVTKTEAAISLQSPNECDKKERRVNECG